MTSLYTQVRSILEAESDKREEEINYRLKTQYHHLIAWALDPSRGLGIFKWDQTYLENSGYWVATRRFEPRLSLEP
jgi:O-antigen ligase